MLNLDKEDFFQVNIGAQSVETEKYAVLSPGYGLGYSTIVPAPYKKGTRHYVWGGEGGHAAFSPINEEQIDFMFWAIEKLKLDYLSSEKAISQGGIKLIYEYFHEKNPDLAYQNDIIYERIVEKGIEKEDKLCKMTVNFFLDIFATEIGNMVCREKILGGVYLTGFYCIMVCSHCLF